MFKHFIFRFARFIEFSEGHINDLEIEAYENDTNNETDDMLDEEEVNNETYSFEKDNSL
jgi:hypothetical protein